MNNTTKKVLVINQAKFCGTLMDRLHDSVCMWADADCPVWVGYGAGLKEEGATKTQIMQDVMRIRRELNKLAKLVDK